MFGFSSMLSFKTDYLNKVYGIEPLSVEYLLWTMYLIKRVYLVSYADDNCLVEFYKEILILIKLCLYIFFSNQLIFGL